MSNSSSIVLNAPSPEVAGVRTAPQLVSVVADMPGSPVPATTDATLRLAADVAVVLWTQFLRYNPADPHWPNCDRFILSGGHGSMLLYALRHLTGYELLLAQLQAFRQWGEPDPRPS